MPRWQRVYLTACAAVIGYALGYVISDFAPMPRATYFPEARRWEMLPRPPTSIPMNYYGTILWGLAGGVVGAAFAYAGARLWGRAVKDELLLLVGGWAITAVVLASAYFLWNLWPF